MIRAVIGAVLGFIVGTAVLAFTGMIVLVLVGWHGVNY
jgi:hypothetical protein